MMSRFFVVLTLIGPVFAHKFHVSYTTLEWNRETESLEIVLQLFPDDLEAAISQHQGKKVALSRQNEGVIFDYLQKYFEVRDGDGLQLTLTWVGMEMDVHRVWVYLELPLPNGLEGITLQQRVFFDLYDDQINSVHVKSDKQQHTLIFESDTEKMPLLPAK